jgi:hypothetical protein
MMPHYGARSLCARALAEPDPDRLASPWQTDADLGRPIEVVSDMSRSRRLGFTEYHPTDDAFFALLNRIRAERLIPQRLVDAARSFFSVGFHKRIANR